MMYAQIPKYIGWPIVGVLILLAIILYRRGRKKHLSSNNSHDDGLFLLFLLDEAYQRLKAITRQTIKKLKEKDWQDMEQASIDLIWLTDIDVESAIEEILLKNVVNFTSGKPMTIMRDSKRLATKIKESPLFTRNPEDIAKDTSIILQERIPVLKKKMEHDRTYKKLKKQVERERDIFPSSAVSDAIDAYLDHSIKINAAWVMSVRSLDGMHYIEGVVGHHLPMKFKVILMGLPGRMDEEMARYRNKAAIAIFEYLKEIVK